MNLAEALWIAGSTLELCVLGAIVARRLQKAFPVFTGYLIWALLSDLALVLSYKYLPHLKVQAYTIESSIEFLLEFAVLVELAWSVLKPMRASLPKGALVVLGVVIGVSALVIWPFAASAVPSTVKPEGHFLVQLTATLAILRVGLFLVIASFSQLLSIGWKDRELQIATGLGFYSIIALIVAIMQSHPVSSTQFGWLDDAATASYLGSLGYWVLSFATKEQERRDFSPQMQQFLLLMSGGARSSRVALTAPHEERQKQKDN